MAHVLERLAEYRGLFDRRVWVLTYGQVVQSIGRGMLMPFMALYFYNVKGFPLTLIGSAWMVGALLSFVASIVAGALADRIGRRPIMLVGMGGTGVVVLAYAFVETVPQFFLVQLSFGVVGSMFGVGSRSAVADITPADRRVRAYGLLYMANNFGSSIGLLVAGLVILVLDYRDLFFLEAAAHFVYFLIILVAVPETFRRAAGPKDGPLALLGHVLRDFRIPLRDGVFMAFIAVDILAAPAWSTFYNVLAPYMKNYAGLPDSFLGPLIAVNTVMVVLLQIPIAAYAERRRRSTVILQAHFLLAYSMLIFWLAARVRPQGVLVVAGVMGVALVVYTLAEIMRAPVTPALISELAPDATAYGKYLGFVDIVWIMGGGIGAVVGGALFDAGRAGIIWPAFAAATLASIGGLMLVRPRLAARVARERA